MRIAVLTTEYPWPVDGGGRRRTLAQLRALVGAPQVEELRLLGVAPHGPAAPRLEELRAALASSGPARLVLSPPIAHPIRLWDSPRHVPRVLALRLRGTPYLVAKWDSAALRAALPAFLDGIDVIIFDHLGTTAYLDEVRRLAPGARRVVELHNVESAIVARWAEGRAAGKRALARFEARSTEAYERRVLSHADAVVCISARDAAWTRGVTTAPVHLVPMAIELPPAADVLAPPHAVGFIGSLRWHPNARGLDWLCREVWPRVRAALPQATLELAGSGLDASGGAARADRLAARWRAAGVRVTGWQQDAQAIYARSSIVVAPVVGGSGVAVKVLDGMAAGRPVVTTPDGAAGLAAAPGRELLVGEDAASFAAHLIALAVDASSRARLGAAGRDYVARCHAPAASASALRAALGLEASARAELTTHEQRERDRR